MRHAPRHERSGSDLFIRHQCSFPDLESLQFYDTVCVQSPMWVVNCRNPRSPHKTALPIGFATFADALRAMHALIAAGLGETNAMHQRIKVDHDWAGVRRIMIESLNW